MIDDLRRVVVLITKHGQHDTRVIEDTQKAIVFTNMLLEKRRMVLEIRITPEPDWSNNRMAFEAYKGGYDWHRAKEVLGL